MMTTFMDWYQALPPYMRAYWTIAIAVSIIFIIRIFIKVFFYYIIIFLIVF